MASFNVNTELTDFTYAPMTWSSGYTAFVVDAYAGVIAGWNAR